MEKHVDIWYLTDNEEVKETINAIKEAGIRVLLVNEHDLSKQQISSNKGNIFILNFFRKKYADVLKLIEKNEFLQVGQKYVFTSEADAKKCDSVSNIEVLQRPINSQEFVILLEKSAVIEKYREIVRSLSRRTDDSAETYESLLKVKQFYPFESETQKAALEKIIKYEQNMLSEQENLNIAIQEFTDCHQKSIYELQHFLEAGELLDELRTRERIDADTTIRAQQSVIDFSAQELAEREKILAAQELNYELGREEIITLHNDLKKLQKENEELKAEIAKLKA